ncbi:recombinase family protein [Bacillus cereus]
MKKAVCYYRKSIERESEKSIAGQRQEVTEYAQANNIEILEEFYEVASSMTTDRKELNKLFQYLEEHKDIDYVLVHRFDRMTRDMLGLGYVMEVLKKGKTRLHSATEDNDYENDPFKVLLIVMKTFGSEIEKNNIVERMQEGRMRKQKNGGFIGGTPPMGYRSVVGTGMLEVEEKEVPIVQDVFELKEKGWSLQKISDELNEKGYQTRRNKRFHPPLVRRILLYKDWYEGKCQSPRIL